MRLYISTWMFIQIFSSLSSDIFFSHFFCAHLCLSQNQTRFLRCWFLHLKWCFSSFMPPHFSGSQSLFIFFVLHPMDWLFMAVLHSSMVWIQVHLSVHALAFIFFNFHFSVIFFPFDCSYANALSVVISVQTDLGCHNQKPSLPNKGEEVKNLYSFFLFVQPLFRFIFVTLYCFVRWVFFSIFVLKFIFGLIMSWSCFLNFTCWFHFSFFLGISLFLLPSSLLLFVSFWGIPDPPFIWILSFLS